MGEIAIYNKKGIYKNTYELKPEYKVTMKLSSLTTGSKPTVSPMAEKNQNESDDVYSLSEEGAHNENDEDEEFIEEVF